MSTISNRVMISTVEDGTTLHAQLLSDLPLVQAYSAAGTIPDWTKSANQPTVFVDLLNGTERLSANAGTWSYGTTRLTFSPTTHKCTTQGYVDWFEEVTNYRPSGYTSPVPAIKIITNLATSARVASETLSFSGSYTFGGNQNVGFAVQTTVRMTGTISSGIWGFVEFVGDNDGTRITQDHQVKIMRGRLYTADGTEIVADSQHPNIFTTVWTLNDVQIGSGGAVTKDGTTYYQAAKVYESEDEDPTTGNVATVEDNAIVGCTFSYVKDGGTLTYTAYEEVCDDTDAEQIMTRIIVGDGSVGGTDGGNTDIRSGQTANVRMWVAPASQLDGRDTSWQYFYVKLFSGTSDSPLLSSITGFNDPVSTSTSSPMYGYRPVVYDSSSGHEWASFSVSFNTVKDVFAKNFTAYIKASQVSLHSQQ